MTLAHYDISGKAGVSLASFESGTSGWSSAASGGWVTAGATSTLDDTELTSGLHGLEVAAPSAGRGVWWNLAGLTYQSGHVYRVHADVRNPSSGLTAYLGVDNGGNERGTQSLSASTAWQPIDFTWTPTDDRSSSVHFAVSSAGSGTFYLDNVIVWDTTSGTADWTSINTPASETVYDADGRTVVSILPPGDPAADRAMVTLTTYDDLGRVTDVTVNAITGSDAVDEANLATQTAYDDLGRVTDVTDPKDKITHYGYNRLGQLTDTWLNYDNGTEPTVHTADTDVHTTFAYDKLGELIGVCSAENRFAATADSSACDPSHAANTYAWHYEYDAMGHTVTQIAPVNQTATALNSTAWTYDAGGRLTSVCDYPAGGQKCTNTGQQDHTRRTATEYDDLSRTLIVKVFDRSDGVEGVPELQTTTAYDPDCGSPSSVSSKVEGVATDTISFTYDTACRLHEMMRGQTSLTHYDYDQSGAVSSRKDGALTAIGFTYDWADRLASTAGGAVFGTTTYAYRLDGLLAGQSLGNGETVTLAYDSAKRPTEIDYATAGWFSQAYDAAGNVTSEERALGCSATDSSCGGTQDFEYDGLYRVIGSTGLARGNIEYEYDLDSNRLSKAYGSTAWTYEYDRTDQLVSENTGGTPVGYGYDAFGSMTAKVAENGQTLTTTTYQYDTGGRLEAITPASGSGATFSFDALGRDASRTVGTSTDTYAYVGTSETVYEIETETGANTTTIDSLIDVAGTRLASATATATGWAMGDLHGNFVGDLDDQRDIIDALRYDPYGETAGSYTGEAPVKAPWRFQGRLDVSPGSADPQNTDALYDGGARFYAPSSGVFTSLDSVAGSAINPRSMNRFLYAHANPASLIDPTGHTACYDANTHTLLPTCPGSTSSGDDGSSAGGAASQSTTTSTDVGCNDHPCHGNTKVLIVSDEATVRQLMEQVMASSASHEEKLYLTCLLAGAAESDCLKAAYPWETETPDDYNRTAGLVFASVFFGGLLCLEVCPAVVAGVGRAAAACAEKSERCATLLGRQGAALRQEVQPLLTNVEGWTETEIADFMKAQTWATGNEQSLLVLRDGQTVIAELGPTGGKLPSTVAQLLSHTHPDWIPSGAMPSQQDLQALADLIDRGAGQGPTSIYYYRGVVWIFDATGKLVESGR
jgi:RHS repeat-associated protein